MGVIVSFRRQKAILRCGVWVCADAVVEKELNSATGEWCRETGGPPLGASDPEKRVAEEMARRFGGRILMRSRANRRSSHGIYLSKRQLELNFDRDSI